MHSSVLIEKRIQKRGDQWCVFSEDGMKNLGCGKSEAWANRRMSTVNYFREMNKSLTDMGIVASLEDGSLAEPSEVELKSFLAEIEKHDPGMHNQKEHTTHRNAAHPAEDNNPRLPTPPVTTLPNGSTEDPDSYFDKDTAKTFKKVAGTAALVGGAFEAFKLVVNAPAEVGKAVKTASELAGKAKGGLSDFFTAVKSVREFKDVAALEGLEKVGVAATTAAFVLNPEVLIATAGVLALGGAVASVAAVIHKYKRKRDAQQQFQKMVQSPALQQPVPQTPVVAQKSTPQNEADVSDEINSLTKDLLFVMGESSKYLKIVKHLANKGKISEEEYHKAAAAHDSLIRNYSRLKTVASSKKEEKHLAGQHNQKTHGRTHNADSSILGERVSGDIQSVVRGRSRRVSVQTDQITESPITVDVTDSNQQLKQSGTQSLQTTVLDGVIYGIITDNVTGEQKLYPLPTAKMDSGTPGQGRPQGVPNRYAQLNYPDYNPKLGKAIVPIQAIHQLGFRFQDVAAIVKDIATTVSSISSIITGVNAAYTSVNSVKNSLTGFGDKIESKLASFDKTVQDYERLEGVEGVGPSALDPSSKDYQGVDFLKDYHPEAGAQSESPRSKEKEAYAPIKGTDLKVGPLKYARRPSASEAIAEIFGGVTRSRVEKSSVYVIKQTSDVATSLNKLASLFLTKSNDIQDPEIKQLYLDFSVRMSVLANKYRSKLVAKHLAGKHDQKTHGRTGAQTDIAPVLWVDPDTDEYREPSRALMPTPQANVELRQHSRSMVDRAKAYITNNRRKILIATSLIGGAVVLGVGSYAALKNPKVHDLLIGALNDAEKVTKLGAKVKTGEGVGAFIKDPKGTIQGTYESTVGSAKKVLGVLGTVSDYKPERSVKAAEALVNSYTKPDDVSEADWAKTLDQARARLAKTSTNHSSITPMTLINAISPRTLNLGEESEKGVPYAPGEEHVKYAESRKYIEEVAGRHLGTDDWKDLVSFADAYRKAEEDKIRKPRLEEYNHLKGKYDEAMEKYKAQMEFHAAEVEKRQTLTPAKRKKLPLLTIPVEPTPPEKPKAVSLPNQVSLTDYKNWERNKMAPSGQVGGYYSELNDGLIKEKEATAKKEIEANKTEAVAKDAFQKEAARILENARRADAKLPSLEQEKAAKEAEKEKATAMHSVRYGSFGIKVEQSLSAGNNENVFDYILATLQEVYRKSGDLYKEGELSESEYQDVLSLKNLVSKLSIQMTVVPLNKHLPGKHNQQDHAGKNKESAIGSEHNRQKSSFESLLVGRFLLGKKIKSIDKVPGDYRLSLVTFAGDAKKKVPTAVLARMAYKNHIVAKMFPDERSLHKNGFSSLKQARHLYDNNKQIFYQFLSGSKAGSRKWDANARKHVLIRQAT